MKNVILVLSGFMIAGLIIGTYFYHNQASATLPQPNQPNDLQENTTLPDEQEQPQPEPLQPVNNDTITYTLQNDELNITFNNGNDWVKVPIEKDQLFEGEYNGNKQELIENSYMLTENRVAFIYSDGVDLEGKRIRLIYSSDQGITWKESVVIEPFPPMRFRKVDFLNDQFGYAIISGDRTMSQEYSRAFITHDGGETWEATAESPTTRLIAFGGFVDETTGFLSYGTINPEEPDVYVTQDSGETWNEAVFNMPVKYNRVFVQAEVPVKEEDHLVVLVNQGPNGDYKGGLVKGEFISEDNGLTWNFSAEVQPNETE
ncbi:sialidase family protein [Pseudogracilibacillus auburnensis]|uniref:BNR/Asp-box repeat protein n=1 Tax=Pseudogracilibacillus auburnensis TaxID=1494959 RepID=A0A2V3W8H8_9BACI|nr:sialidase family protein [Pseudogracilibacillus auburnensis]PXW90667.1 BNR/Asp-box repeat protein [Pseudogracilibacillus auburnensis]